MWRSLPDQNKTLLSWYLNRIFCCIPWSFSWVLINNRDWIKIPTETPTYYCNIVKYTWVEHIHCPKGESNNTHHASSPDAKITPEFLQTFSCQFPHVEQHVVASAWSTTTRIVSPTAVSITFFSFSTSTLDNMARQSAEIYPLGALRSADAIPQSIG